MTPDERRKKWYNILENDCSGIENRIDEGIEKNRKNDCRLQLTDRSGKPVAGKKVKITQKTHDFKFGANLFMLDEFKTDRENETYRKIFKKIFNMATVPFYWNALEPEKGKPCFEIGSSRFSRRPSPDLCMDYCEKSGIKPKLHCLVYDNYLPDWLPKQNMTEMEYYYEKRIAEIAERYAGRMREFEVINETMSTQWWHDQSVISSKPDVVEWAFKLARKYLPNESLIINEGYPIVSAAKQDYRNPYFLQVENCLLKHTSIDRIGTQHHIFVGNTARTPDEYDQSVKEHALECSPLYQLKALDVYAELGLPLELTELTIPTFGETPEDEKLQAEVVRWIYSAWFSHPAADSVVYWNIADGTAFRSADETWYCDENNCRGGLFRRDLTPKKSAEVLDYLINQKWHTGIETTTDSNGFLDFRGFCGDYILKAGNIQTEFSLHKDSDPLQKIEL